MLTRKGVLALLALTLTACTDAPSGPSDTALTPTAPSFAVLANDWFVHNGYLVSCGPTPEVVFVQGRRHQVVKQTGDKFELRLNIEFKGVGQTTENTYVAQFNGYVLQVIGPPFSQTSATRMRLIAKGSADNVTFVDHVTITSPPLVITSTFTSDCKG